MPLDFCYAGFYGPLHKRARPAGRDTVSHRGRIAGCTPVLPLQSQRLRTRVEPENIAQGGCVKICGPLARMAEEACRSMSASFGSVLRTQSISSAVLASSATGRHSSGDEMP